jgi:hypothetical protein
MHWVCRYEARPFGPGNGNKNAERNGVVKDDIEAHFDQKSGSLVLSCGTEAFTRLAAVVIAEVGGNEVVFNSPESLRWIEISTKPCPRRQSYLRDRLALLGCGLVVLVVFFVLAVGVMTIFRWMG